MRFLALLCTASLSSAGAAELSLADYARTHVPRVYTIDVDRDIPFSGSDNTNNFAQGDKMVQLSRLGLNDLTGIATLRVNDGGVVKPLGELDHLHLYLNQNAIRVLPEELYTLRNLEFLYLYYNRLDEIPAGVARLTSLLGLYVTGNNIPSIPPAVFTMKQLRKLQVSKNRLTVLPPEIGNLTQLRHFNIAENQIEVLPDTISRLMLLRVCDFSGNRIARLPEGFGKVPIMHQLRVCDNPLTSLPAGFAEMPGSIDVTGTRIDVASLPPAIRAKISREKVTDKNKDKTQPRRKR
jgi:hypothetical protein